MPVARDLGACELPEAPHTTDPPFEMLVVTLDRLLFHLARDMVNLRPHRREGRRVDRGFVRRRRVRPHLRILHGTGQEDGGGGCITRGADVDVDDVVALIDCAESVTPLAGDPNRRLIDRPSYGDLIAVGPRRWFRWVLLMCLKAVRFEHAFAVIPCPFQGSRLSHRPKMPGSTHLT